MNVWLGAGLVVGLSLWSGLRWGRPAALATAVFGLLAVVIQFAAHRLAQRPTGERSPFPAGWLAGSALRLGGVVLFAALVLIDRTTFAPLPSALGYLGVLIPLLMLELRKTR